MTDEERDAVVAAAVMLKQAAILNRDIAGALSVRVQATMPEDISRRLYSHEFESAFDGLPLEIRVAAATIVNNSEWLADARAVHRASEADITKGAEDGR